MPHFHKNTEVSSSIEEVAALHRNPEILKELTPPWVPVNFHRIDPQTEGSIVSEGAAPGEGGKVGMAYVFTVDRLGNYIALVVVARVESQNVFTANVLADFRSCAGLRE